MASAENARYFKATRVRLGWSLQKMANYVGMTSQGVYAWENGKASISYLSLAWAKSVNDALDFYQRNFDNHRFILARKNPRTKVVYGEEMTPAEIIYEKGVGDLFEVMHNELAKK